MIPESFKILDRGFYESHDILKLSKKLLNKYLISQIKNQLCISRIVEVEAYKAPEDKASHAYGNKRTPRTEVMFGPPGFTYVYLCYGIHRMLNVVSAQTGFAHAILIRALEPIEGISVMQKRRNVVDSKMLCNGPGKLCQAMGVELLHNGIDLTDYTSSIVIADNKELEPNNITSGPRVGISYAEECAHWPWRFRIKNSPFSSHPKNPQY